MPTPILSWIDPREQSQNLHYLLNYPLAFPCFLLSPAAMFIPVEVLTMAQSCPH